MNKKQMVVLALLLLCAIAIWDVFTHGFAVFSPLIDPMAPKMHYGDEGMGSKVPETRSQESVNIDAAGLTKLSINNPYGRILIRGDKSQEIKGDLTIIVYASSEEVSKAYLQQLKLDWKKTGSAIEMDVRHDWQLPAGVQGVRVDFQLTVPEGMELDLVGNDHVKVEQITGKVKVKNFLGATEIDGVQNDLQVIQHQKFAQLTHINGNIRVSSDEGEVMMDDVQGRVQIESNHGQVGLKNLKGDVEVKTNSSQTSMENVEGRCTVNSFNGAVTLRRITGSIAVKNTHSTVQIEEPQQDVDLTIENGDVEVKAARNHTVHAKVLNGSASSELPELQLAKDGKNQLLTGTIGDGKYQLKIEVKSSGRIIIE